jgi:hypothetical protein
MRDQALDARSQGAQRLRAGVLRPSESSPSPRSQPRISPRQRQRQTAACGRAHETCGRQPAIASPGLGRHSHMLQLAHTTHKHPVNSRRSAVGSRSTPHGDGCKDMAAHSKDASSWQGANLAAAHTRSACCNVCVTLHRRSLPHRSLCTRGAAGSRVTHG